MLIRLDEKNYMLDQRTEYDEVGESIGIHFYIDGVELKQDGDVLFLEKESLSDLEKLIKIAKKFCSDNTEK